MREDEEPANGPPWKMIGGVIGTVVLAALLTHITDGALAYPQAAKVDASTTALKRANDQIYSLGRAVQALRRDLKSIQIELR